MEFILHANNVNDVSCRVDIWDISSGS